MLRGGRKIRLIIGAGLVLFAVLKYCSSAEINPYTNEKQHIGLSETEEIAMGLNAAPQMAHQHGGLHPDTQYQNAVDRVGKKLVNNSIAKDSNYKFDFHLLADERTINAFALPGGQIFITYALFSKLENIDQLAGILGHEIGHVLGATLCRTYCQRWTYARYFKRCGRGCRSFSCSRSGSSCTTY